MIRENFWGLIVLVLYLFCAPAVGKPLVIKDVYLERHAEDDFRRLSSRFHANRPDFPFTILRTDQNQWEGVYFILSLSQRAKNLPSNAEINLRYLTGGDPVLHEFHLSTSDAKPRSNEIWIGLTGAEQRVKRPCNFQAWAIDIRCNGKILAAKKSFLFREK
ncbi:MAG: hypothetical protein LBD72_00655 [Puniceicoccales bacterium]|nr:hypothetical protein [Puniceicoccales bacterium]